MDTVTSIPEGWLTAKDVAKRLGVTHSRVTQFVTDGRIKATRDGGRWLFQDEDVDAFQAIPRRQIHLYPHKVDAFSLDRELDDYEDAIERSTWLDDHGGGRRGLAEEFDERWA